MSEDLNKDERLQAARRKFEEQKKKMKKKRAHSIDFTKVIPTAPSASTATAPLLPRPGPPLSEAASKPPITSHNAKSPRTSLISEPPHSGIAAVEEPPKTLIHDYENEIQSQAPANSGSIAGEFGPTSVSEVVDYTVNSPYDQQPQVFNESILEVDEMPQELEPQESAHEPTHESVHGSVHESVQDSVQDSVQGSIQDSVQDSIQDPVQPNPEEHAIKSPEQSARRTEKDSSKSIQQVSSPQPKRYQLTAEDLFGPSSTSEDAFSFSHPPELTQEPKQSSSEKLSELNGSGHTSVSKNSSVPRVDPMDLFGDSTGLADPFAVSQPKALTPPHSASHSSTNITTQFASEPKADALSSQISPPSRSDFEDIFGAPHEANTDFDDLFNSHAKLTVPVREEQSATDFFKTSEKDPVAEKDPVEGKDPFEERELVEDKIKERNNDLEEAQVNKYIEGPPQESEPSQSHTQKQLTVEDLFGADDNSGTDHLFGPYSDHQPPLITESSAHTPAKFTAEEISITPNVTDDKAADLFEVDLNDDGAANFWDFGNTTHSASLASSNEQSHEKTASLETPTQDYTSEITYTSQIDTETAEIGETFFNDGRKANKVEFGSVTKIEPVEDFTTVAESVARSDEIAGYEPITESKEDILGDTVTENVASKPAPSEPVASEPDTSDHVASEHDASERVDTEPFGAKAFESKPVTDVKEIPSNAESISNELETKAVPLNPTPVSDITNASYDEIQKLKDIIKEQEETIKSQEAIIQRQRMENTNIKLNRMDLNDKIADLEDEIEELKAQLAKNSKDHTSVLLVYTDSDPLSGSMEPRSSAVLSSSIASPLALSAPIPSALGTKSQEAPAPVAPAQATAQATPKQPVAPKKSEAAKQEVDIDALFSDITKPAIKKPFNPVGVSVPFESKLKSYALEADSLFPDAPKEKESVANTIDLLFSPSEPITIASGDEASTKHQAASSISDFRERLMVWKGWQIDMTQWGGSTTPKVAL